MRGRVYNSGTMQLRILITMRKIFAKSTPAIQLICTLAASFLLTGCANVAANSPQSSAVDLDNAKPTYTVEITPSPEPLPVPVFIDPHVPTAIASQLTLPQGYAISADDSTAIRFTTLTKDGIYTQIYAAVASFFTVRDAISSAELEKTWVGETGSISIRVTQQDAAVFSNLWGEPSADSVKVVNGDITPETLPDEELVVTLLPFEALDPRWKVLTVDGFSPLDASLDVTAYPLAVHFGFRGLPADSPLNTLVQPETTNRHTGQMTSVIMTGTTALARAIANRMDTKGVTYPDENVRDLLRSGDITHISNEVSFTPDCPPANPLQTSMMFCSRPEYLDLLQDVGVDVVELTGNHNLDWGYKPYLLSLEMYQQAGIPVYGGGVDADAARAPYLIEHNGNRFAFLGCNYAGPRSAQATRNSPGAAACDYDYLTTEIQQLRQEGYLPIVTVQHAEYYHMLLSEKQQADFTRLSQAGAVIVQGSQSHFPQPKAFTDQGFIDYGPGNLFFDQMDRPVKGTRNEFITRYTFYQGRLLSIQLTTWELEDYAQPRAMTAGERSAFLQTVFNASIALLDSDR